MKDTRLIICSEGDSDIDSVMYCDDNEDDDSIITASYLSDEEKRYLNIAE